VILLKSHRWRERGDQFGCAKELGEDFTGVELTLLDGPEHAGEDQLRAGGQSDCRRKFFASPRPGDELERTESSARGECHGALRRRL